MPTGSTLLCIHRDPTQLSSLRENGYKLVTATNGHDGLRLFMSQAVDAIVLDYHLGLLDGLVVASQIKQVRPKVPIVLVVDSLELPEGALKSVDAVVAKSDGPHFLWAAVDFVVNVKPTRSFDQEVNAASEQEPRRSTTSCHKGERKALAAAQRDKNTPFTPGLWQSILDGTIRF